MTPLNLIFTIIIAMLMAAGSWGLGKREKPRDSQGSESGWEINSESVSLVSEAAMNIVEQVKELQSVTFPTQEEINVRLAGLKTSHQELKQLTVDDFKDDVRLKSLMPDPEEFKNLKTDFAVEEIAKDQLLDILMPNPDVDPSFDANVDNKSVEFLNLKEAKCWFSKKEMEDAPVLKKLVLAGTGASAVNWEVTCKSPTEQQWLAAFKNVDKPDLNSLDDGKGEYLDDGKVIGLSDKAKDEKFKKAMTIQDRMNALRGLLANKDNGMSNITAGQINERAQAMAGGGTGMAYLQYRGPARAALEAEARARRAKNAEASASETYAYRWVIPYRP